MVYLILSILCGALLSISMRLSEGKINSKLSLVAVNYAACMVMGIAFMGFGNLIPAGEGMEAMVKMGIFNGVFYMGGMILNQYNIPLNGVVLTSVFSKMGGLLVPLAVAIAVFRENPTMLQILGFVLSMISIIMISQRGDQNGAGKNHIGALIALFVVDGCAGIMAKVFRELGNPVQGDHFLFVTFCTAFSICTMVVLSKKERPGKNELIYGLMVGIPNFMSARFQLMALETIPAVIVYPVRSVGTIVLITLAGVFMFREKMNKIQGVALVMILISLVLLNV